MGMGSPQLTFQIYDGKGGELGLASVHWVNPETWTHVAATFDGSFANIYINGEWTGGGGTPVSIEGSNFPLYIGKEGLPTAERSWVGSIDEVRFWNRALSQNQIRQRMSRKLGGNEPGLVGYWNFDTGTAADRSIYAKDGVLAGEARIIDSNLALIDPPRIAAYRFTGDGFELAPAGIDFDGYLLQASANLLSWETIRELKTSDNGFIVRDELKNRAKRFYRIVDGLPQ